MRFEHGLLRGALALIVGLTGTGTASAVTPSDFDEGSYAHPGGTTFPYRIFVPPAYDPSAAYPLVLFLHGSGERGTDNRRQVFGQQGFFAYVDESVQDEFPTFLVAPQLPAGAWVDDLDSLLGLVDSLVEQYALDEDRLYVTGLSLGGQGTFGLIAVAPERFAAAVPMSGFYFREPPLTDARAIPIWNFHAADDDVVPVDGSRSALEPFTTAGGSAIYTEYATGGHVIWTRAYDTPGLVAWTMAQRRGAPSTAVPPVIRLDSSAELEVEAETAALSGRVESLGTVTRIEGRLAEGTWTELGAGPSWDLADIPLELGANRVEVRAFDDAETSIHQSFVITRRAPAPDPGGTAGTNEDSACRAAPTSSSSGAVGFLLAAAALFARRRKRG